jgi:hypothetical protein
MRKLNNKGAFSIIAALLVAAVLISTVIATYSVLRYSPVQEQPQILSAIDETNLGIKQMLGFTVGYYGSVLKVTGNVTYAQQLAKSYLNDSLKNMGEIRPEWGASFRINSLDLKVAWFTNNSFSQGTLSVNYDLSGLGISGITYTDSTKLQVVISQAASPSQAQLTILRDNGDPLINLGKNNLKFYRYMFGNSSWGLIQPSSITSYADGSYVIDMPSGVSGDSYGIQVDDTRGIMVIASSFSQFNSAVTWNSTSFDPAIDYVDNANLDVLGTHSNFAAQQDSDGTCDTLTEAYTVGSLSYYPLYVNLAGSTTMTQPSGNITADTCTDNSQYLQLHSYPSAFSSQTTQIGYSTKGIQPQSIEGRIAGSMYTTTSGGQIQSMSAAVSSTANNRNVKVAIYQASDGSLVASTNAQTIGNNFNGWLTFTFSSPKPVLSANTNYVLVAWADSGSGTVNLFYDGGTSNQGYADSRTYGSWPNPDSNLNPDSDRKYSINCTYTTATQYTAQAELVGSSDLLTWQQFTWSLDSSITAGTASCTFQLFNNGGTPQYPLSGDGYLSTSLTTSDSTLTQTITTNPHNFRNSTSYWKIQVTAVNTTAAQFDLKLDLAQLSTRFTDYALDLQEQWLSVNASNVRQDLCIKTGIFTGEPLVVQVWHGGVWQYLTTLAPNYFNNASLVPYIDSSTLQIRFVGYNDLTDQVIDTWNIDSVNIKNEHDINFLKNLQDTTFTVELLQNGTMRWLGQNLQTTTQTYPLPPIPVKSLHVNETVNGVSSEVALQIEDWASDYQIPLGLTNNATVFSNRQMLVFLLNGSVSDFTIWWDGNDNATQTPLAYRNRYFSDDVAGYKINNGKMNLQFSASGFDLESTVGSVTTSANLMKVNDKLDTTDSLLSFVIPNGVVRDVVLGEAEYSGGVSNCPNFYTNIVVTLPAKVDYYTYQLHMMFLSILPSQNRVLSGLCPVAITTSASPVQTQTENLVLGGVPVVQNSSGTYIKSSSSSAHHFSQYITLNGKGSGVMFTEKDYQRLYAFDSFGAQTGSLNVTSNRLIELLPVDMASVSFRTVYDIIWQGAVATFDNSAPICKMYDDTTPSGLWILAEYPPTLTVTARS